MSKGAHVHEDVLWGNHGMLIGILLLLRKTQTYNIRTDRPFYC